MMDGKKRLGKILRGHLGVATALVVAVLAFAPASRAQTKTPYGDVEGVEHSSTFSYLGIPYAAAPVGANRFAPPMPPAKWTKPLAARSFGPACAQLDLVSKKMKGQEDCLTLNIWRPKLISRPLPVLVFIHGGGNTIGSSAEEIFGKKLYDGTKLAEAGNIVVTLNYRLGPFGFLAHPALKTADGLQGNYAILDQISALKFVKASVADFGGNPDQITVFGESAGAINTLVLIASPLAQGLFQRAIIQSGFLSEVPLATAEPQAFAIASSAGCPNDANAAACLRNLSTEKLLSAASKSSSALLGIGSPTIDGYVLKTGILESIRSKRYNQVPVIIGTNRDEFRTLLSAVVKTGPLFSRIDYENVLVNYFGRDKSEAILAEYPSDRYATPKRALEEVLNDHMSHCPARAVSRALIEAGTPAYRYVFTHTGDNPFYAPYGAGHALELPFVFGTLGFDRSLREYDFSRTVRSYWSAFAASGNPLVKDQPLWPLAADDTYLDLAPKSAAKTGFHNEKCDFWDAL
ncbi:MAG: carboxylesterase family protein [Proteobacteria bacterium]|nr:MAG: carboxylesterase family protein [Pseudomonadota bacterium]